MGHIVAKDLYGALAGKIDVMTVRAPQTAAFRGILEALYSKEEAALIVTQKTPRLVSLGAHTAVTEPDSYFILHKILSRK